MGLCGRQIQRIRRKEKNQSRTPNPEVFEVLFGLQAGEKVITSSYDNYGDNIDKLVLK